MYPLAAAYPESVTIPISRAVEMIGALKMHELGFTGKGIKVAVLDTGVSQDHPMIKPNIIHAESMVEGEGPEDAHSHGCLSANTKILTTYCGFETLEGLWNNCDTPITSQQNGEVKYIDANTIGMDGIVKVKALYRTKADKKVIIKTPLGTVEATTWHKFFVAVPRKSEKRVNRVKGKDTHPRLYNGIDIVEKTAESLKSVGSNFKGDRLVLATYRDNLIKNSQIDPKYAYLHGYATADGMILIGKIYNRMRYEIRLFDEDLQFLEKVNGLFDGSGHINPKVNSYELDFYKPSGLPEKIQSLTLDEIIKDHESLRAWVAGFFDGEGYVSMKENKIKISNSNILLLEKLQDILNCVGVPATIWNGGISKGSECWHLVALIPETFYEFVKPYCIKKLPELEELIKIHKSTKDKHKGKLCNIVDGRIIIPIISVETVEADEWFYDLSTESENYSANGIIVHNSWCASAIAGVPVNTPQGQIFGVAPEAKLIILKVLSDKGSGSMADVVRGMERAVELGADIVSMSLGSLFGTNLSPDSRTLNELASRSGVLFVTAAGNSFSPLSIGSPACAALSIGVGAVAMQIPSNGSPSTYSSKGPTLDGVPKPDISTYGGNVLSPGLAELLLAAGKRGSYSAMAGTSMATPIVSGALALLLSAGVPRNRALFEELFARTGGQPFNTITGWGLLDVVKLHEAAAAGVFPLLSLLGNVPYALAQPLYQLMPKPKPETIRLQIL